jgi:hypothetical protein
MFRYRVHDADGEDLGEATYSVVIRPGDEVHLNAGERFRVLDVVPLAEDDSRFDEMAGMLKVEAA